MFTKNDIPFPRKVGRPKNFETPDALWNLAIDYFENTDQNPWHSSELLRSGDMAGVSVTVYKQRPYTWDGLNVYSIKKGHGLLEDYQYNKNGNYSEFSGIIKQIDKIMRNQKFDGATNGAFNPNIIARDLGLAERTISETKDTTNEIDYDELSESALNEILSLQNKTKKATFEDDELF